MRCKVPLVLINLHRRKDERDEDEGDKTPNECLTEKHKGVFLDCAKLGVISYFRSIGMVRGSVLIVWVARVNIAQRNVRGCHLAKEIGLSFWKSSLLDCFLSTE